MRRAIIRRLVQLAASLLERSGADRADRPVDANGRRGQDDQTDENNSAPAPEPEPEPEPTPGPPARQRGGGDDQSNSENDRDDNADDVDLDLDLSGMQNPCVGSTRWNHAPEMPAPPDDPAATIHATIWPEAGESDVQTGCEMAARHLEYLLLDAWGDRYDAIVTVATEAVPEYVKDRAGFKEWATNEASAVPAEHINVHAGTDGPPGSACCGWGYVNVNDYFDEIGWTADSGCVKRRRWGPVAYGVSRIMHEALHCLGISHGGDDAWLKDATVDIGGDRHSPVMGTSYVGIEADGWHLMALHPENDQQPEL
jgi:hypothetical protein